MLPMLHAVAPFATADRRVGIIAHPPVGDHPGREPANDKEARYRQDQQLLAQRNAESHRSCPGDRADQGATTPRAMETWHEHPAGEPLDRDCLGVHRHVEHPLEEAPEQELLDRFSLVPNTTLMIDDTKANLETASKLGIQTALFRSSRQLRAQLEAVGVWPDLFQRRSGE